MTLWMNMKVGLSRLLQVSTRAVRYALAAPTADPRSQDEDVFLLHPRCCRTERHF